MSSVTSDVLMPISVLGSFGVSIYYFTRVMTDYILKKKMIEKGYVGEEAQSIFKQQQSIDNKYSSLKWGLIVFFAGVSLVIMEFLPVRGDSPMPYGVFAISVSLGFLIYYAIVQRVKQ